MKPLILTAALFSAAIYAQSPISSEEDAIAAITASIAEHKLTSLSSECLIFIVEEDGETYQIEVREKHDDTCGGDPNTAPRLFGYTVHKANGELATDAMREGVEWDGEYHKIP